MPDEIETIRMAKKKLEKEITDKLRAFENEYHVEVDGYVNHFHVDPYSNATTASVNNEQPALVLFSMSVRI